MSKVMIRYTVKPDRAAENEALVGAVYAELTSNAPEGFRYATFALEDGVSFVHIASSDREDGHNPLGDVQAFAAFQKDIGARCEAPPVVTQLREVGSYRFFG